MLAGVKNSKMAIAVLTAIAVLAAMLCLVGLARNPPGFYIDESSVAYNAQTIAQNGRDENGVAWPLYFRAFGDYKNPVYIYLLAALFRLTGPNIVVPRLISAIAIILAAAALGILAKNITRSRVIALLTAIFTLATPWLFELGRVAIEAALYPLGLVLFLLAVHRASTRNKWGASDIGALAATLAILSYTYSIGRLLAPLFALGLILFFTRERRLGLAAVWGLSAILAMPIALFAMRHPGALTDRFRIITYLGREQGPARVSWEFAKHFVRNLNPWRLLVRGDPNPDQIVHVFGTYLFLAGIFVFSVVGIWIALRRAKQNAWWRYVLFASFVSIVPASLTNDTMHMLRLIPLPIFLLVLAIPGVEWMTEKSTEPFWRSSLIALVALSGLQAIAFQWKYHRVAQTARRVHLFDAEYPTKIFAPAVATKANPIYLADALWIPGYIQAFWYATLKGIDISRFHRLPPDEPAPVGGVVISTEENCPGCEILAVAKPYTLSVAKEPARPRAPLPPAAFRAELALVSSSPQLRAKKRATLLVRVKNISGSVWPARERGGGAYQVSLGNHWLDGAGKTLINDDGRSALLRNLRPGETVEVPLTVNAPAVPGKYVLEIDMLQEGVTWFGLAGSQTIKTTVDVD